MRISFLTLFLAIYLAGCQPKTAQNEPGSVAALNLPSDTTNISTPQSRVLLKNYKGFYIPGKGSGRFKDCATGRSYLIEDPDSLLKTSREQKSLLSYPGESIYAEVRGYLKGNSVDNTVSDQQGVLHIQELVVLTQKSYQTECYNYEFIALGNEPFWSLEIIPLENVIALKDVSRERVFVFSYKKPSVSNQTYTYTLVNDNGDTLAVVITAENCNDGMSDRNYRYSASLIINGKALSGCAIKKGDKL